MAKKKTGGATTRSHGITPKTAAPPQPKAAPKAPPAPKEVEGLRCLITDGDANVAVHLKEGEVRFRVEAGVYTRPSEMDDAEWRQRVKELLATGEWVDLRGSGILEVTTTETEKVVYILAHPDNERGTPKTGRVAVEVEPRGEVWLELEDDGTVHTEDAVIAKALEAKGYLPAGETK